MGTELSLMTTVPSEILELVESTGQQRDIGLDLDIDSSDGSEAGPSRRDCLTRTIERLHASLAKVDEATPIATRVSVHDLGALEWGEVSSHVGTSSPAHQEIAE